MNRYKRFSEDPFAFVDQINLSWRNFNLNFFQKYKKVQSTAIWGAVFCLAAWIIFGFDSTPLQFIHVLYEGLPALILGKPVDLGVIYSSYYGKEMHWSAFVIYFILFYGMSRSWEKAGVVKCKNLVFSFAGMFLAISCFEWFWIVSYGVFQGQPWVMTWQFPQMKILLQNTFFSLVGGLACLYMLTERYFWHGKIQLGRAYYFDAKNWRLWLLVIVSVAAALLWIYYPWHVDQIQVQLENGASWQSSRLFPQTLYTVDLNPGDQVNAGVWFWIQNDSIHALNTIVKGLWAATAYFLFRVKKQ